MLSQPVFGDRSLTIAFYQAVINRFHEPLSLSTQALLRRVHPRLCALSRWSQNLFHHRVESGCSRPINWQNRQYFGASCRTDGWSRTSCPVHRSPRQRGRAICRSARLRKSSRRLSRLQILYYYLCRRCDRSLKLTARQPPNRCAGLNLCPWRRSCRLPVS